ncbi:TIGR03986 family CRISPR-associated RAMP protein [Veillonella sp.]|jgi:CRISPR-associated protein|uniref:TIGR03986 family type III CRISPR-associated RAMP protein n=1 Tax=Veillonella sp. TaxID=1926307 RepID=UPI0025904961|nr:TIGR03986 family CRISPR-associated RAMP protein [Veillonella sp.]MDU5083596.1 TIGR03986 family CRISPR-associated RAMP protein [Veillonella sp.]
MAKTQAEKKKESQARMAKNNGGNQRYGSKDRQESTKPVSLPYNFVSLPEQVIPAEFFEPDSGKDMKDLYKQHVLTNGKNSGYIDIDILTQTPLFIGGNVVTKNGEEYQEFFGGNDHPIIPGSSIKSMIKQILKIVTASGFKAYSSESGMGDFENRRLFYREIGNKDSIYHKNMIESCRINGKWTSKPLASAGIIIKTINNEFYVVNAKFETLNYKEFPHLEHKNGKVGIDWSDDYVDIHTGQIQKKSSFVRILKPTSFFKGRIELPKEVIENYGYDYIYNRYSINKEAINLLDVDKNCVGKKGEAAKKYTDCSDITYVVPCFYKIKNGKVQHFGHGRFYRTPYEKSIADHLPTALKQQKDVVDLTESILGYSREWAGRVYFSEAHLCSNPKWCECNKPQPLMGPKPTSYQFYLQQNTDNSNSAHNHWDSPNTFIKGYKLYWHQPIAKANSWKNPSIKNSDKLSKYIQPIDSGITFKSRIYFDNLSDIELGALLLTLNLDTEAGEKRSISYKLGKGKSIGLGSIKLNSSLYILNRDKRYNTLFYNNAWQLGETDISKEVFIDAFRKYRNDILGDDETLEELVTMMDWNIANGPSAIPKWKEAVTMMPVGRADPYERYIKRVKLGTPTEFIKAWSKK